MIKSLFLELRTNQIDLESLRLVKFNHLVIGWGHLVTGETAATQWAELKKLGVPLGVSRTTFDEGGCPADPEAKGRLFARLKEALSLRPEEIWLDHFRFDGHWEMVSDGQIPGLHRECHYCRRLNRSEYLAQAAQEIMNFVGEVSRVGYFAVPFRSDEVPDLVWSLGQSYHLLRQTFDLVSPMLYHRMIRRPVSYISEYVRYLNYQSNKPILPIIQVKDMPDNLPDTLAVDEIKAAFREATQSPSTGVVFFSLDHAVEKGKVEVIRELFASG